jgi:peptidylprolyl isomerase
MSAALGVIIIVLCFGLVSLLVGRATPQIPPPDEVAGPPADAIDHGDGLYSKVLKAGHGTQKPRANSVVVVHYTGWTTDGRMFDSSVVRKEPARFALNRVIPGWQRGVVEMVEGERRLLWISEPLAYPNGPGPRGMLVFDIALLQIND